MEEIQSENGYLIDIQLINDLDTLARLLTIIRRSKLKIKRISVEDENNGVMSVKVYVNGDDSEVLRVNNKIEKMYEVLNVKYTQIPTVIA